MIAQIINRQRHPSTSSIVIHTGTVHIFIIPSGSAYTVLVIYLMESSHIFWLSPQGTHTSNGVHFFLKALNVNIKECYQHLTQKLKSADFIHKSYTSTHRQNERVLLSFINIRSTYVKTVLQQLHIVSNFYIKRNSNHRHRETMESSY